MLGVHHCYTHGRACWVYTTVTHTGRAYTAGKHLLTHTGRHIQQGVPFLSYPGIYSRVYPSSHPGIYQEVYLSPTGYTRRCTSLLPTWVYLRVLIIPSQPGYTSGCIILPTRVYLRVYNSHTWVYLRVCITLIPGYTSGCVQGVTYQGIP